MMFRGKKRVLLSWRQLIGGFIIIIALVNVFFLGFFVEQMPGEQIPDVSKLSAKETRHVHILYGLCGDHAGFLTEFETSLKSILLNNPDCPMTIHIMADQKAHDALPSIWNSTGILHGNADDSPWRMRNPTMINTYNVEPYQKKWFQFIENHTMQGFDANYGHTIGTYYRLFAHEVLETPISNLLYLDTDVVLMANLDGLWRHIDDSLTFQWGKGHCAGFIVLNVQKLPQIWETVSNLNLRELAPVLDEHVSDQLILKAVNYTLPREVGYLPDEWDVSLTNLWYGRLLDKRSRGVGILHINGGLDTQESAFHDKENKHLTDEKHKSTWGLVDFYTRIPWTWVKFTIESSIVQGEGYLLIIKVIRSDNKEDKMIDNNY